jgi:hypothetical protein
MNDTVATWLRELSHRAGIQLRMNADGDCVFGYGEELRITVSVPPGSPLVFLAADVGGLPSEGRLALYENLLSQNLFFDGTNGATFALDTDLGRIVLNFAAPIVSLDGPGFENALGVFVETAEKWMTRLAASSTGEGSQAEKPDVAKMEPADELPSFAVRI